MTNRVLRTCSRSDPGIRTGNEDACGVREFVHPLGPLALVAVADGLGGHPAGEVASALAIATLVKVMEEWVAGLEDLSAQSMQRLMEAAFTEANNAVVAAGDRDVRCWGLGTTLVAALVNPSGDCVIGNVGDSRAYLVSGDIRRVTRDHSRVQDLVDQGFLSPSAAERHPMKNIVTRVIGRSGEVPDLFSCRLDGARLLLCSDGLMDGLDEQELCELMQGSRTPGVCDLLVARALERSRDNITVIVAEWTGGDDR